jgi:hypothetical protein
VVFFWDGCSVGGGWPSGAEVAGAGSRGACSALPAVERGWRPRWLDVFVAGPERAGLRLTFVFEWLLHLILSVFFPRGCGKGFRLH